MANDRLNYLFEVYMGKTCTEKEKQELAEIILEEQHGEDIDTLLLRAWENNVADADMPVEKASAIIASILHGLPDKKQSSLPAEKIVRLHAMPVWKKAIAVAAILIVMLGGSYLIFISKSKPNTNFAKANTQDVKAPKTSKATIILANGQTVLLDSISSGLLVKQGNVNIIKNKDGEIIYTGSSSEMQYNTLFNPRGSKVANLTLSDGTKVWLNSESSLRYPIAFTGNDRKVEITGEAYFEVTHDAGKHFFVDANGAITEVLGTHFNVNSYVDERDVKVTLLEGSVKVAKGSFSGLLIPGQQAQINETIQVTDNADMEAVMAWKNGYFNFSNTSIVNLLKQVSRWYDVSIVYERVPPIRAFGGEISRSVNLSQVVKILTESNVKCRIQANNLIIE